LLLLQPELKHDSHAYISLGNIFFANLHITSSYDKYMKRSQEYYRHVLEREPYNMFAANGLGMVLAERGFLHEAKDVFTQVSFRSVQFLGAVLI
jgi:RNA polymerase-associated protein CTR9